MATLPAVVERGNNSTSHEFGIVRQQSTAETSMAAVQARETARVNAMYVMAERHVRNWDNVRVRLLQHCDRGGFAEIARYKKPAGKKQINGQWVETFAEGLSARFAETARQEMGNTSCESSVVYEDDLIRVVRIAVVDVERNNHDYREATIAKVVEKKGKKNKQNGEWEPPEGREVISQRINSYGDPVFLVKATDDEIRIKQNSEISKTQRDEALRLIPKDIRDDCEARILATLRDPKKVDPATTRKRVIDAFAALNVFPDDLVTYIGCPLERCSPVQMDELRGLHQAIKDGETTFNDAMQVKYDNTGSAKESARVAEEKIGEADRKRNVGGVAPGETAADRDVRIERQIAEQAEAAKAKEANQQTLKTFTPETLPDAIEFGDPGAECIVVAGEHKAKMRVVDPGEGKALVWEVEESVPAPQPAAKQRPVFGRKPQ